LRRQKAQGLVQAIQPRVSLLQAVFGDLVATPRASPPAEIRLIKVFYQSKESANVSEQNRID
jgi:hypothetical protein